MNEGPELPHDLLELVRPEALECGSAAPEWVWHSLAQAPVVVVRRAPRRAGLVPVGVRGPARSQRFAAWAAPGQVVKRIRPEDLAAARAWRRQPAVPQLAALEAAARLVEAEALAWGPAGSAGFELATGVRCIGPSSDLDLVIRAPDELAQGRASRLFTSFARLGVPIDVQLETPRGAVALVELASGAERVVLRTASGPALVPNPWASAAAAGA